MKFLFSTLPDDEQAIFVKLALEAMGHEVRLLFPAELPSQQKNSIYLDNRSCQWKSSDRYDTFLDNGYDVVWWRAFRQPSYSTDLFYESMSGNLAPGAFWVNPREMSERSRSRLFQLRMASECGLNIPMTLCSNDPKDIRYFLLKHEEQGVICQTPSGLASASRTTFADLPDNQSLQQSPKIYQVEFAKQHDIKVVCFGDNLVAATLDPDGIPKPCLLPVDLEHRIRHCLLKMGLVFACFDFAVSMENQYVFLGVEERAQILCLEEQNPVFRMLDLLTAFLLVKHRAFRWNPTSTRHRMEHYKEEVQRVCALNQWRYEGCRN